MINHTFKIIKPLIINMAVINNLDNFTKETSTFEMCVPMTLGGEWGSGAFGKVHVVDTPTGRIAVKCVPELEDHVNRELETCKRLAQENHPNICATTWLLD